MTAVAVDLVEPSAIATYIAEQRRRDARDLVRGVLRRAWSTEISAGQAARVLMACGFGVTEAEIDAAIAMLDVLENPRATAEAQADDVGFTGSLVEATTVLRDSTQDDLDAFVEQLVRNASGVALEVAVLAVVNVLVGAE